MTQDEIIEMARQAARHNTILNQDDVVEGDLVMLYFDELETFAKLVAAKEREACAKVCEDESVPHYDEIHSDAQWAAKILAGKIRARGEA